MRILSRHDTVDGEKCPKCLTIFQHFADFEDGKLGCLRCGTVFLGKKMRDDLSFRVKDILIEQKNALEILDKQNYDMNEDFRKSNAHELLNTWECPCGFEAKSRAGLAAHQRRCVQAAQAV